jgi:hypothetical protein
MSRIEAKRVKLVRRDIDLGTALKGELHRILDDVEQDLLERPLVGQHVQGAGQFEIDGEPTCSRSSTTSFTCRASRRSG